MAATKSEKSGNSGKLGNFIFNQGKSEEALGFYFSISGQ